MPLLAAAAVVFTSTAIITVVTASAAAEDNEDKNDYPGAVVTTEVTHFFDPLFLFSSHTMLKGINVLQIDFILIDISFQNIV